MTDTNKNDINDIPLLVIADILDAEAREECRLWREAKRLPPSTTCPDRGTLCPCTK